MGPFCYANELPIKLTGSGTVNLSIHTVIFPLTNNLRFARDLIIYSTY